MKTFFSTLLVASLFLYSAIEAVACPAFPGLGKAKQPDGAIISLYLRGDEKMHWMESEDGYSLLYDNNKNIVYATADKEGNMVPSSIVARDVSLRSASDQAFLKEISKKLNYSQAQINTFQAIWKMAPKPSNANSSSLRASVGTAKAICALINFPDKPLVKTKADFDALMNQVGYSVGGDKGSVHDYYIENSYGQLNLVITVAGPYTVSKPWAYYGANDPATDQDYTTRVQEFATEAANLAFKDPAINPADYDNDGDGYIDAFHIIYAGYGEEVQGSDPNCIWAHEFYIPTLQFGTKQLYKYSCSCELQGTSGSSITHIGVICHEMGHIFGAPDFYDTDDKGSGGQFTGTGKWDLMGSGNWNNNGACPAHINMYQKIQYGWVNPTILTQPQAITGMLNSANNAVAYRYDTSTPGEYYILENRQQTGFDQYVPGNGLLIYHVSLTNSDINNNRVNVGSPQKMYPVCASASTNPSGTPDSYGSINTDGCPFPGTSNKTSFTDYTIPSATSWNGANTVKPITEIQQQSGVISFNFLMPDVEPVTNLQATPSGQSVQLTWNKPSSSDIIGYNIYRNNVLLTNLLDKENTSFTQYSVATGSYSYCVTACYPGKESAPVCQTAQITNSPINGNSPIVQNLTAQNVNGDKDIQLNWQSPFVSDWIAHTKDINHVLSLDANPFVSAVRFTVDDLQNFYGSKLTKVRFAVNVEGCQYTIQAWLKDPGLTTMPGTPVINQLINKPALGINEITLDSPISLVNNKELWIGIQYQMTPMGYVAVFDLSPSAIQRNWVYTADDGWQYIDESDSINWFISGYLQFDNTFLSAPANTWLRSATATTAAATNYIVYRDDNVKIATTTQTQYLDVNPPSGSHIYRVAIAYDDGSESEQACVNAVSPTINSIEQVNNQEGEFNLFPNPVKRGENLSINCDAGANSTLSLYTISGQLIQKEQITGPVFQKRMDFEPGIYLLKVNNNSKSFVRRIIVK